MDGQHETFLLFSLSILKNCRFYLEFQQKNANALYILLNQMKTGLKSRERVRKLQKKKEQKQKVTCRCRFWAGYFNTNAH